MGCSGILGKKIENKAEKHNGASCTWVLSIIGNPVSLPLQGHNQKHTEKSIRDEKNYIITPRERIRETRALQPREETL